MTGGGGGSGNCSCSVLCRAANSSPPVSDNGKGGGGGEGVVHAVRGLLLPLMFGEDGGVGSLGFRRLDEIRFNTSFSST